MQLGLCKSAFGVGMCKSRLGLDLLYLMCIRTLHYTSNLADPSRLTLATKKRKPKKIFLSNAFDRTDDTETNVSDKDIYTGLENLKKMPTMS